MKFAAPLLIAPVARWCAWKPCLSQDGTLLPPDVSFVEPMLRRRLSSLTRMTLRVAYDCAHGIPDVRFVYASRHGELARTTTMLEALAGKDELSPAIFSMSVLNASTGLFSMLEKNVAPATAISAGCSSFGYGLLEACMQLKDHPEHSVLFVYADEPAPAVYGEKELAGSGAHAVGMLLQSSADTRVEWFLSGSEATPSDEVQSQAFLRCLETGESEWCDGENAWSWKKQS
ncbi:MAG: beta-ketoacyl synthase chain length factor [Betaproteobacteria bacterium]